MGDVSREFDRGAAVACKHPGCKRSAAQAGHGYCSDHQEDFWSKGNASGKGRPPEEVTMVGAVEAKGNGHKEDCGCVVCTGESQFQSKGDGGSEGSESDGSDGEAEGDSDDSGGIEVRGPGDHLVLPLRLRRRGRPCVR
jgi:hypothetical protein